MSYELFHGSTEQVTSIRVGGPGNLFDGLFFSRNKSVAECFGGVVNELVLSDDEVLTHYALNYECEEIETIRSVLACECPEGVDLDRVWEIVIEDKGQVVEEEDERLFYGPNSGWEAQRIRGRVAAALGYKAVEMFDENGVVFLVVSL